MKGRTGILLYPERYRRSRRSDVRYRPVKQRTAADGIDHRTLTRLSTSEEQELARRALEELKEFRNRIALVPAPEQNFVGHKIRVIESRNPDWYIEFGKTFWANPRSFTLKRERVEKALQRIIAGRVRGNGYETRLLECLKATTLA